MANVQNRTEAFFFGFISILNGTLNGTRFHRWQQDDLQPLHNVDKDIDYLEKFGDSKDKVTQKYVWTLQFCVVLTFYHVIVSPLYHRPLPSWWMLYYFLLARWTIFTSFWKITGNNAASKGRWVHQKTHEKGEAFSELYSSLDCHVHCPGSCICITLRKTSSFTLADERPVSYIIPVRIKGMRAYRNR